MKMISQGYEIDARGPPKPVKVNIIILRFSGKVLDHMLEPRNYTTYVFLKTKITGQYYPTKLGILSPRSDRMY